MQGDREARIRHRAYEIWEQEGRPEGRHDEHWQRARHEVDQASEPVSASAAARKRPAAAPKQVPAEAAKPAAPGPSPASSPTAPRRRAQAPEPAAEPAGNGKTGPAATPAGVGQAGSEKPARRGRRSAEPNSPE